MRDLVSVSLEQFNKFIADNEQYLKFGQVGFCYPVVHVFYDKRIAPTKDDPMSHIVAAYDCVDDDTPKRWHEANHRIINPDMFVNWFDEEAHTTIGKVGANAVADRDQP